MSVRIAMVSGQSVLVRRVQGEAAGALLRCMQGWGLAWRSLCHLHAPHRLSPRPEWRSPHMQLFLALHSCRDTARQRPGRQNQRLPPHLRRPPLQRPLAPSHPLIIRSRSRGVIHPPVRRLAQRLRRLAQRLRRLAQRLCRLAQRLLRRAQRQPQAWRRWRARQVLRLRAALR